MSKTIPGSFLYTLRANQPILNPKIWHIIKFLPTLPVLQVVFSGAGLYIWQFIQGETYRNGTWLVPYISHAGTYPPESSFFTFALTVASFYQFVIVTYQYRIVHRRNTVLLQVDGGTRNIMSLLSGYIATLGVLVVGCFPTSDIATVHAAGVGFFVAGGQFYMYSLVHLEVLSLKRRCGSTWRVKSLAVKRACAGFTTLMLFTFFVFSGAAYSKWTPGPLDGREKATRSNWRPEDGGFYEYRVAALLELAFMLGFLLFMFTLQRDFLKYTDSYYHGLTRNSWDSSVASVVQEINIAPDLTVSSDMEMISAQKFHSNSDIHSSPEMAMPSI